MFDLGIHDHSSGALLLLAISAFVAALARGFSGFGSALIFVPLASTAIGPKAAAPLLLIIDGVAAAGLIPRAWRHADRRNVGTMSIGALAGIPLGAWVLIKSDPLWIRWAVALFGTLLLALLMSGWRYRGKPTIATTVIVGATAGLLGGAAQIGGPPIVAYWLSRPIAAETVRANIVLYFAISTVVTTAVYLAGGLLTPSVVGLALVTGPIYGVGLAAAAPLRHRRALRSGNRKGRRQQELLPPDHVKCDDVCRRGDQSVDRHRHVTCGNR